MSAPVAVRDRLRIADLYAEYAACLDDGRYAEWPEFFTETCTYKLIPRENYDRGLPLATLAFESKAMLHDRAYGIAQTLFHEPYYQRHLVSGFLVSQAGGGFAVRANYVVVRTKTGALSDLYNAGRYVDRLVDEGGVLRFAEKLCVFDSELVPNSLIYPI